jgi:hypothetical protein
MTKRSTKFRNSVTEEFDLNAAELLLVDEIAAVLDTIDGGGLSTAEERQQRVLLSRLLYQLSLPEAGVPMTPEDRATVTSLKARRASRARWDRVKGTG